MYIFFPPCSGVRIQRWSFPLRVHSGLLTSPDLHVIMWSQEVQFSSCRISGTRLRGQDADRPHAGAQAVTGRCLKQQVKAGSFVEVGVTLLLGVQPLSCTQKHNDGEAGGCKHKQSFSKESKHKTHKQKRLGSIFIRTSSLFNEQKTTSCLIGANVGHPPSPLCAAIFLKQTLKMFLLPFRTCVFICGNFLQNRFGIKGKKLVKLNPQASLDGWQLLPAILAHTHQRPARHPPLTSAHLISSHDAPLPPTSLSVIAGL